MNGTANTPSDWLPAQTPPGDGYGYGPYGQTPYDQGPYDQGPYGQAPYGQPPYGQPPAPAGWGPSPGAAPGGPPGRAGRGKGGRTALVVTLSVVLVVALAGGGVWYVNSRDGKPAAAAAKPGPKPAATTAPDLGEDTGAAQEATPTTEAGTGPAGPGQRVSGRGYAFDGPAGWVEVPVTPTERDGNVSPDSAVVTASAGGDVAKVLVFVVPIEGGTPTLAQAATATSADLRDKGATGVSESRLTTLGGRTARVIDFTTVEGGERVKGRRIIALRGSRLYAVDLRAPDGVYADGLAGWKQVTESWEWR
jgi:hypothetical protein